MQIVITAVGPDNRGLADPIIHHVTGQGANITEIQMYDHDEQSLFAMLLRIDLAGRTVRPAWPRCSARSAATRACRCASGRPTGVPAGRGWPFARRSARSRRWPCCGRFAMGTFGAEAAVMIGNRPNCRSIAEQFGIDWHLVGDEKGIADDERLIAMCDEYEVDYLVLARYMRVLPPASCWKYAGGRILNLHHGLLPSFPGIRPYHEAFASRMLTYGATCHFIVPELDAGNQIIYQSTFTVAPGDKLDEIIRRGQEDNEPHCLVEGVRRVVDREVQLHFHRVVTGPGACRQSMSQRALRANRLSV